ncbi:PH domain-containing protein [Nocardia cyriacigeorgica]|uniref:PH domain-containing protein n=1 Tax=Nocardia cyriacigeorgica TaxID=135487 RepID=UPI001895BBA0|nr:PH domain-containing protein [Nocardia cyriacigeorgica]MBF6549501.1 PH domain-containing protein [Nocardia cyriacigeorgica]
MSAAPGGGPGAGQSGPQAERPEPQAELSGPQAELSRPQAELPWLRLDKRMLLVHPVDEVVRFIPVLLGTLILGTSSGNHGWSVIPFVAIVGYALTRWFTTTYRVGPTHVELRTGLLQRKKLAVPRSRIRSVDIEADLLHRILGLAVLAIGTGRHAESGEKFQLDALDADVVPALRTELLAHTRDPHVDADRPEGPPPQAELAATGLTTDAARVDRGREIGHWRAAWVRYAPLSLTGFAIVAPIVGVGFQYGLGEVVFRSDAVHSVEGRGTLLLILFGLGLLIAVVLVTSLAACAHYLATYFGLRVTDNGTTLHLRYGLFTTRQVTLDLARFRGATVNEPLLLRLAGGAALEAIMTGQNPRQKILPQAPRAAVDHTLAHLLSPHAAKYPAGTSHARAAGMSAPAIVAAAAPARVELTPHGPAARRRRYTHAMWPVPVVAAVLLLSALTGASISPWWWLLPAALIPLTAALAEDRYRGLGHAVLPATATAPTWLITRSGSLDRDRDCLEAPGIIGWTVRQTFWQRRAGLATVTAATAAGKKRYHVIDLPLDQAWALIETVTPGRLGTK